MFGYSNICTIRILVLLCQVKFQYSSNTIIFTWFFYVTLNNKIVLYAWTETLPWNFI